MDETRFPSQIPGVIGGKTFLEVFELCPKIVEFVDSLWTPDKTTGVYKKFFTWVLPLLPNDGSASWKPFLRKTWSG